VSDINIKFKADKLGKDLENLADNVQRELNDAIQNTANAAFATIIAKAQTDLNSTRADYLKGVQFDQVSDSTYIISLEGDWANALEQGFAAFDMRDMLLKSRKTVGVGSRAGLPWVQESKEGNKFAHVPFTRNMKAPKDSNLADSIKKLTALNSQGKRQKFTKLFKDDFGNPQQGKVAVSESDDPTLDRIAKFQRTVSDLERGTSRTYSIYMNWKTISEGGKPWMHKGYEGLRAFDDAEEMVEQEIDNILNILL